MVDEEGEGLLAEEGVGHHHVGTVDGVDSVAKPFQIQAAIERDVGDGGLHVAHLVVEAEEDGALGVGVLRGKREVDAQLLTFFHHAHGKVVVAKHTGQPHLMTQQTQVMGDVTGHATMVEGDAAGRAALCVQLAMRLYGDVDVGFAYDGDVHFS